MVVMHSILKLSIIYVADGTEGLKILKVIYTLKAPSTTYHSISVSDSSKTRTSPAFSLFIIGTLFIALAMIKRKNLKQY